MGDDWRDELVGRFPQLFGRGDAQRSRGRPRVGDGWRSLLAVTLQRIADAVGDSQLQITGIEQKYGSLRIDYSGVRLSPAVVDRIENSITLSEALSEHTCEICGAPGRLYDNAGVLSACCPTHAAGRPVVDTEGRD